MGFFLQKIYFAISFCILLCFIENPCAYTESAKAIGWIGLSVSHFTFQEFDNNGRKLLTEKGSIPGIQAGTELDKGRWFVNAETAFMQGEVTYKGQTNTGKRLSTITDETIINGGITGGVWLAQHTLWRYGIYCGVGHRWWWRDIRSAGNVNGISETYTNWYGIAGSRLDYSFSDRIGLSIQGHLNMPINTKLQAQFYNRDKVELNLQEEMGFNISCALKWQCKESLQLVLKPCYTTWNFGRSEIAPLTWRNVPVGTVYEPDSETRNIEIQLAIVHRFL